jgi:DNA-binding NtrC family response regulator
MPFCDCRCSILVVDQDDWSREFLFQVIKLIGLDDFKLVATVDEGLALLEQSVFDLLITDLRLPEFQRLLESCRQRFPAMRYILMLEQRAQSHLWVFHDQVELIFKPPRLDELARKIRHAIHQKHRHQMEEEYRRLKQEVLRIIS